MAQQITLADMREVDRTPFGERLFKARKTHAKMSQATLAEKVGTTQSNINALEVSGQGSSFVSQIAKTLGVRVEWLTEGIDPMTEVKPDAYTTRAPSGHHAAESVATYGLQDSLTALGSAIATADPATRSDAIDMLVLYFKNPTANAGLVPLIESRLLGGEAIQNGKRKS